jgi:uncharacterized protein (TIGR03083 family)
MADVTKPGPLFTAHLFPTLDGHLIELLRSLTLDDWERQTVIPQWKIKDVAAHLLDTQLRRLSFGRDGYVLSPAPVITGERDLVSFINRLNAEGVRVYRRLSPPVLLSWMEHTSREAAGYLASLDPFAPARFAVSWAGETASANWFDIARELTERWHHQQQIRLAISEGLDGALDRSARGARNLRAIMTTELYHPVLDCFMRALPFHYRSLSAPSGSTVRIHVSGECGGDWYLCRGDAWSLSSEPPGAITSSVSIPEELAWRIFTKGIAREDAGTHVHVSGDAALGNHVLDMVAIVG